jgi:hypothetical protein
MSDDGRPPRRIDLAFAVDAPGPLVARQPGMIIDIGPTLRKVLLSSGLPLLAAGCADNEPTVFAADGAIDLAADTVATDQHPFDRSAADMNGVNDASVDSRPLLPDGGLSCLGGWGADRREGGCLSGSYTQTRDEYRLIDPANQAQLDRYRQQCLAGEPCDNLCRELINYQPIDTPQWMERFGTLVTCAPACRDDQPGMHVVYTVVGMCQGRRPEGLSAGTPVACTTELGAYFAQAAGLEAASVPAFARLARELAAHGAPPPLVAAARRALRDEVRHFHITRALARRFGGLVRPPRVPRGEVRPLAEVAAENTREGCVGETFGAATAAWQARAAAHAPVRIAMASIARDEVRHASLAWQIEAWARRTLPPSARTRLDQARTRSVAALEASLAATPVTPALTIAAGLPPASKQRELIAHLHSSLWRTGAPVT